MNWFNVVKIVAGYVTILGPLAQDALTWDSPQTAISKILSAIVGGLILHKTVPTGRE